jgi:hypothetical protein
MSRVPIAAGATAIAVATLAVSGFAAARLTGTVVFPAGDEPHYLIIAQSLWRDGDLAIENNHGRGDYREYFSRNLDPHYLTRGVDGQIYSIHPVGLGVLMAPVFALGGYPLVVWTLIAIAAAAAAIMWRGAVLTTASPAAATFAWAAIAGSAPFLLNAFAVYPEIPAALAAILAFTLSLGLDRAPTPGRAAVVGLAAAALPWLSTKYAPMSAAIVAVALARLWVRWPFAIERRTMRASLAASVAIATPYAVSLAGWFAFFYAYWGIPLPQAPYGALVQTDLKNLVFGAPGLLFDQEYGLLAYAPVYILAATGLALMWKRGGESRRRAVETTIVVAALVTTVGAFRIWWGGSASPGRPLVSGLLLLGVPIATAFHAAARGSAQRAAQHLLLWVSAGIALTLVLAQEGMLIANGRDGSSSLIEYLSPLWEAWSLAPSFVHHEAGTAWLHSAAWLGVAALAAVVLRRARPATAGAASLTALTVMGSAVALAAIVMPLLPSDPPQPRLDLRARARLGSLDSFDRGARPIGLVYDPLRRVAPAELLPMLALQVDAGTRTGSQPRRVLHNGRFSLPAGRYRATIQWSQRDPLPAPGPQRVDLQVGRIGPPLEEWRIDAVPGQRTDVPFSLPVDAGFVGFRGSVGVERSIQSITITPVEIVDAGLRTSTPPVLAASHYEGAIVLFHDDKTYPEPSGFWTLPGGQTAVTLAMPDTGAPAVLRLHPGPQPNHVSLSTYGWRNDLELMPGTNVSVPLPGSVRRIVKLAIGTADGFVPSELDPASGDSRRLGAWVEVSRE